MAKLEAEYKKQMVEAMLKAGFYARRIEDQFTVGMPDLVLVTPERTVFGEAKRFTGETTRASFAPSPRQNVEMYRIEKGGGKTAIIGINLPSEKIHIADYNPETKGKVTRADCCIRRDGETFPELFLRWLRKEDK